MNIYLNKNGKSGVYAYEIGNTFIKVQFEKTSFVYTYDTNSPGEYHVNEMKKRAKNGSGLNTYMNQHVRENYSRKE